MHFQYLIVREVLFSNSAFWDKPTHILRRFNSDPKFLTGFRFWFFLPSRSQSSLRGSRQDLRGSSKDLRGSRQSLRGSRQDLSGSSKLVLAQFDLCPCSTLILKKLIKNKLFVLVWFCLGSIGPPCRLLIQTWQLSLDYKRESYSWIWVGLIPMISKGTIFSDLGGYKSW